MPRHVVPRYAGGSVNPPSSFLRFPDRPTSRIIGLPASLGGALRVDGLKWISSFPENTKSGLPHACAVLIPNDHDTGLSVRLPGEFGDQRDAHGLLGGTSDPGRRRR